MDASRQTQSALIERANTNVFQVLRRFEAILTLAPIGFKHGTAVEDEHEAGDLVEQADDEADPAQRASRDKRITAAEGFQLEVETGELIRAAENMLSLNRSLKEAWLFGRLDTLGQSEAEKKTDEHARAVAGSLNKLMSSESDRNDDQNAASKERDLGPDAAHSIS